MEAGIIGATVRLLTAAATYFNALAMTDYGGRIGPAREPGLVEHAVGAAFQTFGGEDPYPGAFDLCLHISAGQRRDVGASAEELRRLWQTRPDQ